MPCEQRYTDIIITSDGEENLASMFVAYTGQFFKSHGQCNNHLRVSQSHGTNFDEKNRNHKSWFSFPFTVVKYVFIFSFNAMSSIMMANIVQCSYLIGFV